MKTATFENADLQPRNRTNERSLGDFTISEHKDTFQMDTVLQNLIHCELKEIYLNH